MLFELKEFEAFSGGEGVGRNLLLSFSQNPDDFAVYRTNFAGWVLAASRLGDDRIFCRVIDEECDGARGVDERKCEGDALRRWFRAGCGDDVFGGFKKRGGAWEKRGGVPVFADSQ